MEREELIKNWLDNELSEAELRAFEQFNDHDALVKLAESSRGFRPPSFDADSELDRLLQTLKAKKAQKRNTWIKPVMRIAASVVVMIGVYFVFFSNTTTSIETLAAEKTEVQLPDASSISLNALSSVTFNKKNWNKNRTVQLEGEAFFKVAKGSTFDVETASGTVTVLGTQFNVKEREDYFEVVCFEGLVAVAYKDKVVELRPADQFVVINGVVDQNRLETGAQPSWIQDESSFTSVPYLQVLKEFERQFNVTITTKGVSLSQHYTGSFSHVDKQLALASITLPMNLRYTINGNTISILGGVE